MDKDDYFMVSFIITVLILLALWATWNMDLSPPRLSPERRQLWKTEN